MQITRGRIQSAQKVVLYGPEGIGKSTFASQFPQALFIDTEGSTKHMDVARLPAPSSWVMLIEQVRYVRDHPDVCSTLVIDTADWAERMCVKHVCDKAQKDSVEDFGYGKGYIYVYEEFGRLLNLLDEVIRRGIHVLITAHVQIRKFEQPDEMGSYDRYELKLTKKTGAEISAMLKEWADMVLFANYKTLVVNVDGQGATKGKNKAQGGKRVMYTTHTPSWDAKNRHDLPEELPLDFTAIAHCIKDAADKAPAAPEAPSKPEPTPPEEPAQPETSLPEEKPEEPPQSNPPPDIPKALLDLMIKDMVTVEEIQDVVAEKGYYPKATPFDKYDPGFVSGVLVGAWPQVLAMVQANRPPEQQKTGTPF